MEIIVLPLTRINNFLSLPEKNDNLSGLIITEKINSVVFKNVYFKYSAEKTKCLKMMMKISPKKMLVIY